MKLYLLLAITFLLGACSTAQKPANTVYVDEGFGFGYAVPYPVYVYPPPPPPPPGPPGPRPPKPPKPPCPGCNGGGIQWKNPPKPPVQPARAHYFGGSFHNTGGLRR